MSYDSENVPATAERREAVRRKAEQIRSQQARARVLRTSGVVIAIAAVIAAIAVAVTYTVMTTMAEPIRQPANVSDGGIVIDSSTAQAATSVAGGSFSASTQSLAGTEEADAEAEEPVVGEEADAAQDTPVEISIYLDYLSEPAAQFQSTNVKQLTEWASNGSVKLTYHPVALLTAKSNGTKYSLRAASASACVATHAPESFFAYNHELLVRQPAVDTDGFNNRELADMAVAAGVQNPKVVSDCIEGEDFLGWAKQSTEQSLNSPLPGTDAALSSSPTILVNGTTYVGSFTDASEFAQFVYTASSKAYYSDSTPSPSPSESEEGE